VTEDAETTRRPCRFCLAAYPAVAHETCEWEHRDEQRVYDLAAVLAGAFQPEPLTDEQVCWFLADADAIVDDFAPAPERWQVEQVPTDVGEFIMRFRINDVTYVIEESGEGAKALPVRLSTLRQRQREANEEAAARGRIPE